MLLSREAFGRARDFLFSRGRPLDRARFRWHFESGSPGDVLAELARFQNDDGGFGHALESDLRTPASSAIATWLAFAVFRELGTPASTPMVRRAVAYLLDAYDPRAAVWTIVPPEVEDAPHAPWWTYADLGQTFGGCRLNPTASLLGALYDHAELVPAPLLAELTATVLARLDAPGVELDMIDLMAVLPLADAPRLPGRARERVRAVLSAAVPGAVEHDPARWSAYTLQPLDVVRSPGSFLAPVVELAAVRANLDHWIGCQGPDGAWQPTWTWDFVDAQAWAQAELDAKGHLVVDKLGVLAAHGRLAPREG